MTLKTLRHQAEKSAREVADDLNVSGPPTVYAWENGTQVPDHERIIGLARAYHVSVRAVYLSLGFDLTGIPLDCPEDTKNAPTE